MLYRYLVPGPVVAGPPAPSTSWPTVPAYSGTQNQALDGNDHNNKYIFCSSSSIYKWTLSNTVNNRKANSLFYYELTPAGDYVSNAPTNIATANYDFNQTSWQGWRRGLGANPAQLACVAVNRVQGTDTQSTFTLNWSSTLTTIAAAIYYHNGSSWVQALTSALWQQRPVWNSTGTFVAGATTAATGPSTPGKVTLVGWNGTAQTSISSITISQNYINDMCWLGDTLFIKAGTNVLSIYQRTGTTLTFVSNVDVGTLIPGFSLVNTSFMSPDETNNRLLISVVGSVATPGGGTNNALTAVSLTYDNSGGFSSIGLINGVVRSSSTAQQKWPAFPLKSNRMLMVHDNTFPTEMFSTTATSGSQLPFNAASFPGSSAYVNVKAHALSGNVITYQTGNVQIRKVP